MVTACASENSEAQWRRRLTSKRLGELQHACRLLDARDRLPVDQVSMADLHSLIWRHYEQRFLERRKDVPAYIPGVGLLDGWGEAFRLMPGPGYQHYSTGPNRINDRGERDDIVAVDQVAELKPEKIVPRPEPHRH